MSGGGRWAAVSIAHSEFWKGRLKQSAVKARPNNAADGARRAYIGRHGPPEMSRPSLTHPRRSWPDRRATLSNVASHVILLTQKEPPQDGRQNIF